MLWWSGVEWSGVEEVADGAEAIRCGQTVEPQLCRHPTLAHNPQPTTVNSDSTLTLSIHHTTSTSAFHHLPATTTNSSSSPVSTSSSP